MKRLLIFFILPLIGSAQSVRVNRYDAFLQKHRVELEPVALFSSGAAAMSVTFSFVAPELFVQIKGAGWGATSIDEGEELIFRFTNDSTVAVKSVALQTFEPGVPQSNYKHQYRITAAGVRALSRFELAGIRKYSFKEASDMAVPRELSGRLQKAASLFLAELAKAASAKTLKRIDVKEIYRHVGDSVRFCSKIFRTKTITTPEGNLTVLALQSDFSSPVVHLLLSETDRAAFGENPEKSFPDGTVCVSGIVSLRDNVPSVLIRKKEQLAAAAPAVTTGTAPAADGTQTVQKTKNNR